MADIGIFKNPESNKINQIEKIVIAENAFKTLDALNKYFGQDGITSLPKKAFMDLQKEVWDETRRKFNIVVEGENVKITKVFEK